MAKKQTRNARAVYYSRDSGGKHEQTPAEYVQWALQAAKALGLSFDGTPEHVERMMETGAPVLGDLYLDFVVKGNLLRRPALDKLLHDAKSDPRLTHVFIPHRDRLARPEKATDGLNLEDQFREAAVTLVYKNGRVVQGLGKELAERLATIFSL